MAPSRWRLRIAALVACVVATSCIAATILPSPWVVSSPRPTRSIDELLLSSTGDAPASEGRLRFGVVRHTEGSLAVTAWAWLRGGDGTALELRTDRAELEPAPSLPGTPRELVPGELDGSGLMERARGTALVAASRLAGTPLERRGGRGVVVLHAAERTGLRRGDLITEVGGAQVATIDQLNEQLAEFADEPSVDVSTARGTRGRIGLAPVLEEPDGVAWTDVELTDTALAPPLPPELQHRTADGVVGASAGLALALRMYEVLSGEDLLRGRSVMVTGAVRDSGKVDAVGGVHQKVAAARRERIALAIVPAGSLHEVGDAGGGDVTIVGVRSLEEAVAVLRR